MSEPLSSRWVARADLAAGGPPQGGRAGRDGDIAAAKPVRDDTAGDEEQDDRDDLDQPDEAEHPGVTGAIIELPADRHGDDLGAERGQATADDERRTAGMLGFRTAGARSP
jgi:hypothetical protein